MVKVSETNPVKLSETEQTQKAWKTAEHLFDTEKLGLSNMGHDKGIFIDENGQERMSSKYKLDLIKFIQTL